MTRYTGAEALQFVLDTSDEESTFSSEEERDYSDDDRLYFEERLDPAVDRISDENVAKRAKTNIQTSNKESTLSWKTETDIDMVPQTLRFLPARELGPQLSSADTHTPQTLFKMFFSENAVSTLCHNTNAQAAGAIAKGRKFKWTDVSISEMYRYIGLVFYMAMVKVSSIKDYWRQDSLFSLPFPATIMARERYRTISWNVHMSHPDADKENDRKRGTPEHDRLFRVKPLMETIRHACKSIYHPRRNLAVDERMVACKAHTGMTQYMKAKPTRWGFKLFVLADSSNGYTLDFSVYTGKNNFPTGHGLSYDAVTSLLDCKVLGSGYHVYMDNFYTSPKLLKDLFAMKFGACGTYRDNRKDCPRDTTNSLSKKSARGSIRWIRDGPLVFVKWMDTREVSVCSTIQSAYTGETVQRRVKTQDTWRTMTFPCPAPVTAYNKHMGGVDLSDQLLQYYTAQHKTMKWYRKIFLHFLDIAATNAFLIHKELSGNMTHKQFMEQLIAELCGVSQKVAPTQTSSDHVPVPGVELISDAKNICTVGRKICVLCKGQLEKPGQCPSTKSGGGKCAELCSCDRDCPKHEKCCSNGCGRQCMAPFTVKPAAEPAKPAVCAENCQKTHPDGQCPGPKGGPPVKPASEPEKPAKSQDSVQAQNLEEESVLSCVPVIVTVRNMRNAAAMDVDVSVWLHLQLLETLLFMPVEIHFL
ncbi:hypothetical protein PO909_006462 [Leuciscus waleckii]